MREKIHSYLGFAKKSRGLISGFNSCLAGVEKGSVRLLVIATDTAESSVEKLVRSAKKTGTPVRIYSTKDRLSEMTGESGRGVFAITNKSLAAAIKNEIDQDGPHAIEQEGRNA